MTDRAAAKRASMREGPLASLFKRTDEEPEAPPAPQERLRGAFAADLPANGPAPAPPVVADAAAAGVPRAAPIGLGQPMIRVVGVGGAGVNAVNRMIDAEVEGVQFLALNTDQQSLQQSAADEVLHIGGTLTRGLGAGASPELGRAAAIEDADRVRRCSRARTWCSSPPARAAARARARRRSSPAWPGSSAR